MIVLSLFDGMSCGQIALKELGIKVDKYYASEIDKHAIKQTMLNFPDTIQLGSVTDVDVSKLDKIDLLIGGSPCTNFSFAGKRNGMSTTTKEEIYTLDRYLELKSDGFQFEGESFLFWEYMRILNDIRKYNPDVKFMLENVEMGKKWERTLSEAIGLFGVHINSALVSAQNRKRIYWTNIRTKQMGLFGEVYSDIPQPEDRGILLKDVLESVVGEKYYLSNKMLNYFNKRAKNFNNGKVNIRDKSDKATTLCASMSSCDISDNFVLDTKLNMKENQAKANCFTAGGHSGGLHSDMDLICVSMVGRKTDENGIRKDYDPNIKAVQRLEPNLSGKTNCLTSVQKDNLVMQLNQQSEYGNQPRQQNRVYSVQGISPCLVSDGRSPSVLLIQIPRGNNKGACFEYKSPTMSSSSWDRNNLLYENGIEQNFRIRRLTPTECSRLQTIPEWYKWECSDTQAYKMLGNGWTVEVIKHILQWLK